MPTRLALAALTLLPAFAQNVLPSTTVGGSGSDSIRSMAVDASGNIWVVGTTFSADLPLLNSFQATNKGTQVVFSTDGGATWKPLSTPQPNANSTQPATIAVDPTNSSTLYVGSAGNVCKSVDAGFRFHCAALPLTSPGTLKALAIDPLHPATIYAGLAGPTSVLKSTDGGQTWTNASTGLPGTYIDSLVIDPFHTNVLYAWVGSGGYVSNDGAASWQPSSLPWPPAITFLGLHFTFDPVTPGTIYGPGYAVSGVFIQKSSDAGKTWAQLNAPFVGCCVAADPNTSGVLYGGKGSLNFWKSIDGGTTWTSSSILGTAVGEIAVDPSNTHIILAGQYRSTDGGKTFAATSISRNLQPVFSSRATAYALAPTTSDGFVAEYQPDGKTLIFSSYFGGSDNDIGNAIAIDHTGNVWIAGSTTSADLPVTAGAFQNTLKGSTNGFVAKLSSDGKLLAATYLGGSKTDSALGLAVGPQGNPWLIWSSNSSDFPFTTGAPSIFQQGQTLGILTKLDSAATQLLYSSPVNGTFDPSGKGIAIDLSGNIIVTGSTSNSKAFVLKVDSNGQQIYLQQFGGSLAPPVTGLAGLLPSSENARSAGVAAVTDPAGTVYIAGSTSTSDFPVTPGAYQTILGTGCPYPAFTSNTGLTGVIGFLAIDDIFVMKLGPDGTISYATFIGGSCYDRPASIAVDEAGNVSITGETDSADYPLQSAVEAGPAYRQFASFVSSLNATGSALTFSSYLYAGSSPTVAAANGAIYVAGSAGVGAQTQPDSGAYSAPVAPATNGILAILHPPSTAPQVNLTQVTNAFSFLPGPVAPGEIVSVSVPGFVPAQPMDIGLNMLAPLTTNLGGVSVTFDGTPAYVMSIYYGKIVCIAPVGISGQSSTNIQVSINGSASNVLNVSVAATALGLLSADGSGKGLADARNPDGTLNSATNPVPLGAPVTVFFTGAGVTNPPETDGMPPTSTSVVPVAPIATFCAGLHALTGFAPGLFACSYPTQVNPTPKPISYGITVGSEGSQSQELLVYIH
jgi:uncharacterized protein (TIGR03437 family)